jgi:hypothetical protein
MRASEKLTQGAEWSLAYTVRLTAWIDRAQPRSIRCWTSPAALGFWGRRGLNLQEIYPPAFQVPFTIGLDDR